MRSAFLVAGLTLCNLAPSSVNAAGTVCDDRFETQYSVLIESPGRTATELPVKVKLSVDLDTGVMCENFSLPHPGEFTLSSSRLCLNASSKQDFDGTIDVVDAKQNRYPLEHASAQVLRFAWLVRDACTIRQKAPKLPNINSGGVDNSVPNSP